MKINSVIGTRQYFEKTIEDLDEYTTLSELIVEYIKFDNTQYMQIIGQEKKVDIYEFIPQYTTLVCYAEEYNSITENLLMSFFARLSMFGIENFYFQNPPIKLLEQARHIENSNKAEVNIDKSYEYSRVTKASIKNMYENYDSHIVGQTNNKKSILTSLMPILNENRKKPVVLLFYGPTGVGKTETAKYIAETMGGELFRKQFSMLQNERAYDYLFGGKHGVNTFAYELLNRKSNVILLDEFDKVQPTFFSAFYELFDEGTFTDSMYSVELDKAIIICTSNYKNIDEIKSKLGEPIFSRIDKVISFKMLNRNDKLKIIDMSFEDKLNELTSEERNTINEASILKFMNEIVDELTDARDIKSIVQELINTQLLHNMLSE